MDFCGKVQDRRMFPTRVIQAAQVTAQNRVIGRLLKPGAAADQGAAASSGC